MNVNGGIDLSGSGWDNPDGFVKAPRANTPAPPVPPACGATGPDGWTCDRRPHPDGDYHKADDGSPHGLRWSTEMHDASTWGTPPSEALLLPGRVIQLSQEETLAVLAATVTEVHRLATEALKAESPAAWVLALDKIRMVTKS